jgi:hypothetical protein
MASHRLSKTPSLLLALLSLTSLISAADADTYRPHDKEDGPGHASDMCALSSPLLDRESLRMCAAPKGWYPLPGDDFAPWSYRPWCVDPPGLSLNAPPDRDQRFCLYFSSTFAEGRGIGIFSSPRVARELLKNDAFAKPDSIAGMNDLVTGPFSPPPYEPRVFPGKGIGLVANRTLYRGERIMQETPSWVYDRGVFGGIPEHVRIPMHWHGVFRLPEDTRDEILALHKHHGGDEIDDVMRTNAFGAYYTEEDLHNNVLPRISRFNHDCRPK